MDSFKRQIDKQRTRIFALPVILGALALGLSVMAEPQLADVLTAECVTSTRDISSIFESANRCPQANAGVDLAIQLNQQIPLDASRSADIDGQRLSFSWSLLSGPKGSSAKAIDPESLHTYFVPDLAGDYVFELQVTDSVGAVDKDTVAFSTNNVAPVAQAGEDVTAFVGDTIALDATGSYDLDGDLLDHQWRLVEQPADSRSRLSSETDSYSSLLLDSDGDYVIELTVRDDSHESAGSELVLSTLNSAPTANAGRARTVGPNSTVIFDSVRSTDFDSDALSYQWSILSAPESYEGAFDNASVDSPVLIVGDAGYYLVQLIVNDGKAVSNPATTLIEVKRDRVANFDLNNYLPLVSRAGSADTDGDGVADPVDNCVLVANAPQRDTDGDGIGNFCDADLNNDGIVNFIDITQFTPLFLSGDPDADFNGDGIVNFLDYIIITSAFLEQPGPPGTIVWVSLVDGDFSDRTNWQPQIVPTAGSTAIIDVAPAVTVTQAGGSIAVENLVQNENLVLSNTTIEAGDSIQLGGTLSASGTTINNTSIIPSLAGTGSFTLNTGIHNWSNNTIGVPTTLSNGARVNNSNNLSVADVISVNGTNQFTGIDFSDDQTIFGNAGTIIVNGLVSGGSTLNLLRPTSGGTLTLGSGLTVIGRNAFVGAAAGNLIVNGEVLADLAGESMSLGGAVWSGTGTLSTVSGSAINLFGIRDNSAGALNLDSASGGAVNLLAGGTIRNGTVTGTTGSVLTINAGTTNIASVVYDIDVLMANGANSNVTGGLAVNSTLLLNATNQFTRLLFPETQTVGGTGTVVFADTGSITLKALVPQGAGTVVTFGEDLTIRGGAGTVGSATSSFIVDGSINADVDGQTIQVVGSPWSSESTLTASNNATLLLSGTFDNGGNGLNLNENTGGTINVVNGTTLRNTTITGTAGTDLTVNAGGSTSLEAIVFDLDVTLANGANPVVTEGLTINSTLLLNATNQFTRLLFPETQTLGGTGTVVFADTGSITLKALVPQGVGTVVTFGEGLTIRGGAGTVGSATSSFIVDGNINADVDGQTIQVVGSPWSSESTFTASNNATLLLSGTFDNGGNVLNLDQNTGGTITVVDGTTLSNATITGAAGTSLVLSAGGSTNLEAMVLNLDVSVVSAANPIVTGGLTLNGTLEINTTNQFTGLVFPESQTVGGTGVIEFTGNGSISLKRLLLQGTDTVVTFGSGLTILGGQGTIGSTTSSLIIDGSISADTGSFNLLGQSIVNNGLLEALNGHTLTLNNLTASPGDLHAGSESVLQFADSISALSPSSDVFLDVGPSGQPGSIVADFDDNMLDGNLTISAVDGYTPATGTGFTIIEQDGPASGIFSSENSVGLGAGQSFSINYSSDVTATVIN